MIPHRFDARSLRLLLVAAGLLVFLSAALVFGGTGQAEVPMDEVELQRSTSEETVVKVVDKDTGNDLACYELGSKAEVSALILMEPDLDVWNTTTNVMRADLTTAPNQISQTADFTNPTLEGYDGDRTLTIRIAPTVLVQRLMSSEPEAVQLVQLLQRGALVGSRTKHLTERPTDSETYSIDLDAPLASCPQ